MVLYIRYIVTLIQILNFYFSVCACVSVRERDGERIPKVSDLICAPPNLVEARVSNH